MVVEADILTSKSELLFILNQKTARICRDDFYVISLKGLLPKMVQTDTFIGVQDACISYCRELALLSQGGLRVFVSSSN